MVIQRNTKAKPWLALGLALVAGVLIAGFLVIKNSTDVANPSKTESGDFTADNVERLTAALNSSDRNNFELALVPQARSAEFLVEQIVQPGSTIGIDVGSFKIVEGKGAMVRMNKSGSVIATYNVYLSYVDGSWLIAGTKGVG